MKSTKGFTLLELLAVIVVLAIIALIVTPFVTEAIKEAREGADKNAAYGIISAAELYYATTLAAHNGTFVDTTFEFAANDNELTATNTLPAGETAYTDFSFKGKAPSDGTLSIDSEGNIEITGLQFGSDKTWNYDGNELS